MRNEIKEILNSLAHVSDIFVFRFAKIWQTTETYSPQTFSVTAAVVAPALMICLNSLNASLDCKTKIFTGGDTLHSRNHLCPVMEGVEIYHCFLFLIFCFSWLPKISSFVQWFPSSHSGGNHFLFKYSKSNLNIQRVI